MRIDEITAPGESADEVPAPSRPKQAYVGTARLRPKGWHAVPLVRLIKVDLLVTQSARWAAYEGHEMSQYQLQMRSFLRRHHFILQQNHLALHCVDN